MLEQENHTPEFKTSMFEKILEKKLKKPYSNTIF